MQQLKNFLSKREQSQARLRFAECEKSRLKAKIMMTLVLLMTAAAGAWATDYTTLAVGDVIKVGDTFSTIAESQGAFNGNAVDNGETYKLMRADVDNYYSVTEKTDGAYYVFKYDTDSNPYIHFNKAFAVTAISDGLEVTKIETINGMLSYTLALHESSATSGTPVDLTRGTGEKINEWTLTNGMPAGNVLLTVAYKDRTTMALTYGGTAITTEANAVTAFKGCEQEFAEALTPAVQNIEPTFNSGTAQDVTTTLAADFTFKSSDAAIIGFKSGETYADEGTLDQMEFRALTTTPVTLTVTYKGTDDLESKSQALLVTIEKKTYTVSLADNTEDADSWKGNVNDAETDVNLPITKLEGGEKVTLKYNGRLKVKSVTATTDAALTVKPVVDLSTISGTSYTVTEDVILTGTPAGSSLTITYGSDDYEVTLDNVNSEGTKTVTISGNGKRVNVKLKGTSRLSRILSSSANTQAEVTIGEAEAGGTLILNSNLTPLLGSIVTINGGTVKAKSTGSAMANAIRTDFVVNGGAVYLEGGGSNYAVGGTITAGTGVNIYGWNGNAWGSTTSVKYVTTDNTSGDPTAWTW